MDRLNTLANYFNEKERRRLEAKVKENSLGIPEMTVIFSLVRQQICNQLLFIL